SVPRSSQPPNDHNKVLFAIVSDSINHNLIKTLRTNSIGFQRVRWSIESKDQSLEPDNQIPTLEDVNRKLMMSIIISRIGKSIIAMNNADSQLTTVIPQMFTNCIS